MILEKVETHMSLAGYSYNILRVKPMAGTREAGVNNTKPVPWRSHVNGGDRK